MLEQTLPLPLRGKLIALVAVFVAFLSMVFLFRVFAQTQVSQTPLQGLSLSPSVIDRDVTPGDTVQLSVKIENFESTPTTLYLRVANFTGDPNEGGSPQFTDSDDAYALSSWVTLPVSQVRVNPSERKEIPFTMTVPKDAEAGSHFGAIIVSKENPTTQQTGVAATYQVGTLLFAKVAGETIERGRVVSFGPDKSVYLTTPVTFQFRFENTGNVHSKPTGLIEIYNIAGIKEETLQINKDFRSVLPNSTRRFDEVWNPAPWLNLIPRMGYYSAKTLVTYGVPSQTQKLETVTFWILPWDFLIKAFAGTVVGLLLLVLFLRLYGRIVIAGYDKRKRKR